jgi:hypothetical protein
MFGIFSRRLGCFFLFFLKDDRRLAGNLNTYLFFFVKQKMAEGLRSFGD